MRHVNYRHPAHLSGLACACDPQSLDGLDGIGSFFKKAVKKVTQPFEKVVRQVRDVAVPLIPAAVGAMVGGPAVGMQIAQLQSTLAPGTTAPPDAVILQQQAAMQQQQAAAKSFDVNQFIADNKVPLGIGAGLLVLALVMPSGGRRR